MVAERLGYPPGTALTLGSVVAGTAARAKAQRLSLAEKREEHLAECKARKPLRTVRLLGRGMPLMRGDGGHPLAVRDSKPQPPAAVRNYLARAFGDRLGEVRAAMEALAASLPPEELNRVGFRLY